MTTLFVTAMLLIVAAATTTTAAVYAQPWATFDEIDEDHQPLIEEIVNKALNQTADRIIIFEGGSLVITYHNNTTRSLNEGVIDFGGGSGCSTGEPCLVGCGIADSVNNNVQNILGKYGIKLSLF